MTASGTAVTYVVQWKDARKWKTRGAGNPYRKSVTRV